MRISIVTISNEILIGKKNDVIANFLAKKFLESGVTVTQSIVVQNSPVQIQNTINYLDDNHIIIIGDSSSIKNVNIKKAIANYYSKDLELNNEFANIVKNYYFKSNLPVMLESENEYYVPQNAKIIKNEFSALQGFYILNESKNIYFLPGEFENIKSIYYTEILPVLSRNLDINYEINVIKTFGICEEDILSILSDVIKNKYKITIATYPNNLEVEIIIRYNRQLDSELISQTIQIIYERLSKYIYADTDIKLENRACELLKVYKKTLAIGETISGGNITNEFIRNNSSIDDVLKESIVAYDKKSKMNRLKVTESIINNFTEKSVEIAYEMAAGLLETSGADVVLVNAGNITDLNEKSNSVTCYIAVGDIDGIHVYKNNFTGNKQQIIEGLTKTSFFYLIKKLKQNDLQYFRSIV